MKSRISTVLKIKNNPCGIKLFDRKLRETLFKIGIKTESLDIETVIPNDSEIYLLHYVPSLYNGYTNSLNAFFLNTTALKIVIIHGVFPNQIFQYCGDTICLELSQQLNIIINHSNIIISLSDSTTDTLKSWIPNPSDHFIKTLYHPGLYHDYLISNSISNTPYIFLGGITRAKKDFYSDEYLELFHSLKYLGINVWLHSTPDIPYNPSVLPVWKFTTNELDWGKWSEAIFNASWVLCPYNTKIQTVSGIISESISAGTMVLATSFPYSIEMSNKYKDNIIVNDDFKKWPEIVLHNFDKQHLPTYPTWDNFIIDLMSIINNNS